MGKKIVFLPIWGNINQTIPLKQMEAIRQAGGEAQYGLPGTFFPLTRSARKWKPDVISLDWIHQYCLAPGIATSIIKSLLFLVDIWLVRLFFRCKLVWTIHNLQHHDPRPRKLERWISTVFASHCKAIRILGTGVEEEVCSRFSINREKLVVIPEGSFTGYYRNETSSTSARKKLGISESKKVCLHLGALRPYKGVEKLIAFFREENPENALLLIAGTPFHPDYAAQLEKMADGLENVRIMATAIPDDDLQYYFNSADMVVLPFQNVFNSSSVVLAMSFAKLVVAPAAGLIPFRLQKQPRFLYPLGGTFEPTLREALQLTDDELKEIGQSNLAFVNSFSWSAFADFILKL